MKNKDEYIEKKLIYEAAVKDYIERKLSGKKTSVKKIADIHNIGYSTLQREIKNRYTLGEKYQYDHMTKTNGVIFSYQQEELLLKILKESLMSQFTRTGQACRCRTCFLLKLSTSAYEFTASNTKKCPPYWTTIKHADMSFLEEFEMRHRSEISKFCIENCNLVLETVRLRSFYIRKLSSIYIMQNYMMNKQ
ncbi:uncharacterized protein LOC112637756 [Camponotus floridanus]|uniref:uncharacterized protein LOC112637756 n=1 Tax=Camponotus floridanus TaxID=104421 RepID=UPI000DC674DB|nr:uncharacterized protein LOC112637756 [Camponotus floridanus]